MYGEDALTAGPSAPITFKTDFGVTFGIITCFDILFDEPARRIIYDKNVTDILFPTAWLSEMPFLTGKNLLKTIFFLIKQKRN